MEALDVLQQEPQPQPALTTVKRREPRVHADEYRRRIAAEYFNAKSGKTEILRRENLTYPTVEHWMMKYGLKPKRLRQPKATQEPKQAPAEQRGITKKLLAAVDFVLAVESLDELNFIRPSLTTLRAELAKWKP